MWKTEALWKSLIIPMPNWALSCALVLPMALSMKDGDSPRIKVKVTLSSQHSMEWSWMFAKRSIITELKSLSTIIKIHLTRPGPSDLHDYMLVIDPFVLLQERIFMIETWENVSSKSTVFIDIRVTISSLYAPFQPLLWLLWVNGVLIGWGWSTWPAIRFLSLRLEDIFLACLSWKLMLLTSLTLFCLFTFAHCQYKIVYRSMLQDGIRILLFRLLFFSILKQF